jgi:hypothetical protein
MDDENILFFGRLLAERNEGFIQITYAPDFQGDGDIEEGLRKLQQRLETFHESLAEVSDRPILFNAVAVNDKFPQRYRRLLKWLESCRQRGLKIYGQSATVEEGMAFPFTDFNLWEDVPAWKEATSADPGQRPDDALRWQGNWQYARKTAPIRPVTIFLRQGVDPKAWLRTSDSTPCKPAALLCLSSSEPVATCSRP